MRMAAHLLALLAACAGTHAFNPLHEAQAELKEQIKAIDESPWYVRLTNWYSRRRLSHSLGAPQALQELSSSLANLHYDIARENITSASQALDHFKADYCDGTSPKHQTLARYLTGFIPVLGRASQTFLASPEIGYDGMITDFLQNCLCSSHWKLDQPEVTQLWATVALAKNSMQQRPMRRSVPTSSRRSGGRAHRFRRNEPLWYSVRDGLRQLFQYVHRACAQDRTRRR